MRVRSGGGGPRPATVRFQARFAPQPDRPGPQSQSLSRSYGSDLPTSLTYIVLSARGCSPWRPAADMGTTRHENQDRLPRIFKGRRERTGHRKSRGALRGRGPYLRASRFQGVRPLPRQENSSRGSRRRLRVRLRRRTGRRPGWERRRSPCSGSGILTRFPFGSGLGGHARRPCVGTELSYLSGSTDPCSTAVHMEPFSTSAFKVLA